MNRPESIKVYDKRDLKLGIKSSLPRIKETLGLFILLWECSGCPSDLIYSEQLEKNIILESNLKLKIKEKLSEICLEENLDINIILEKINTNQLFKSQIEALIVAFELIWKLGKIDFVDTLKAKSAERTGGMRFPKKITYSINIDIIHCLISENPKKYFRVLLSWIGINIKVNSKLDDRLLYLLTALSEEAIFKLVDGKEDIIFNQNSIYKKILETGNIVDINGDKEAKGSLRILKSLLIDGMNPYLNCLKGTVKATNFVELETYQKRVETFLELSSTKVIGFEDLNSFEEGTIEKDIEKNRLDNGMNTLLYGVPGSGKSWTIEHEYCSEKSIVERLVFHPDYTNADFIGQILPVVDSEKQVTYEFTPGPFTEILCEAYKNPMREYVLIIEEINRGNAPAIFGETFQLLDRIEKKKTMGEVTYPIGTSEYGITHKYMADKIYGEPNHKVRIPSNLSIIGTMNTSDQNVFTLDTAFQRRWRMRLIENNFNNVRSSLANAQILDTEVTWKTFCEKINDIIIGNKEKLASAEDKRLGVYFIHENDLIFDQHAEPLGKYSSILDEYNDLLHVEMTDEISKEEKQRLYNIRKALMHNRLFPEKVIKYLWDDAFKFNLEALFDTDNMKSLEDVIHTFVYSKGHDRFNIFKQNIKLSFYSGSQR